MAWPTVINDLRILLSDGPTDKLKYRKKVFGTANSTNVTFKTFEFRRLTDLTVAVAPLGVYVNGAIASVAKDDIATGEFNLADPPANTDLIEATYYSQWFLDSDLNVFVTSAAQWLLQANPDSVPEGLKPAAMKYAASDAYLDLCSKWAQNYSEMYKLEDAPDSDRNSPVAAWTKLAGAYNDQATSLRDQFYRRSGQALQPLFKSLTGSVVDVVPKR